MPRSSDVWLASGQEQDEIALQSHHNAVAGWDKGFFDADGGQGGVLLLEAA